MDRRFCTDSLLAVGTPVWRSDQLHDDQVHHPSDEELDGQAGVDVGDVEAFTAPSVPLLSRGTL